jgi:transposase, IS5 family
MAGQPLDEGVPDHSAIWRFRQELTKQGLAEAVFEEINRQLDAKGLIVRKGTLIDATLIEASVKPPRATPARFPSATRRPAGRGRTARATSGKAHVAVDEGSEIIRTARC